MISYAQNFEDVILQRIFNETNCGFYIDVGAWDDTIDSVTKHFYDRGWHGINIEPVPKYHTRLLNNRPRDINLNIAIMDSPGEIELFEIHETGLSTTDNGSAEKYQDAGFAKTQHIVEARTLEQICRQYASDIDIEFIKIDTEGTEQKVLLGGNWSQFRPRVLIIEATHPNSPQQCHEEWEPFVLKNGYLYAYFDGLNRFYVRNEDADLLRHFSLPPNVFDNFTSYKTLVAEEQVESLRLRLQSAMIKADKYDSIKHNFLVRLLCKLY